MVSPAVDLSRPLRDTHFVAFDTETTGLVPADERVIELSGVRFTTDGELSRFETFVDPERPIPPESTRVHKITDDDVKGQPRFPDAVGGFLDLIDGAVVLAHNAEFDVLFLPTRHIGPARPCRACRSSTRSRSRAPRARTFRTTSSTPSPRP